MSYTPDNTESYERMLKVMRGATDPLELDSATLLYVFDLSYSRADICAAESLVRKEKGWRH